MNNFTIEKTYIYENGDKHLEIDDKKEKILLYTKKSNDWELEHTFTCNGKKIEFFFPYKENYIIVYCVDEKNNEYTVNIINYVENKWVFSEYNIFYTYEQVVLIDWDYDLVILDLKSRKYSVNEISALYIKLLEKLKSLPQDIKYYPYINSNILNVEYFYLDEIDEKTLNNIKNQKIWDFCNRPLVEKVFVEYLEKIYNLDITKENITEVFSNKESEIKKLDKKSEFNKLLFYSSFLLTIILSIVVFVKDDSFIEVIILFIIGIIFSFKFKDKMKLYKTKSQNIINNKNDIDELTKSIFEMKTLLVNLITELYSQILDIQAKEVIEMIENRIYSDELEKIALSEVGIQKSDIIYENQKPVIFYDISFLQDKSEAVEKLINKHNEESIWLEDGYLISPVQYLQFIFLTKEFIDIFSCYYDFIEEKIIAKQTKRYYYKDVTNISKEDVVKTHFIKGEDVLATKISLQVASGDKIDITILSDNSFSDLAHKVKNDNETKIQELLDKIEFIKTSNIEEDKKSYKIELLNKKIEKLKNIKTEIAVHKDEKINSIINNIRTQIDKHKKG